MRIHRALLAAGLLALAACAEQPVAPTIGPQLSRWNPQPPPPIVPADWTVVDLTPGTTTSYWPYALSDAGWVFVGEDGVSTGFAFLTNETPMRIVPLPGSVGGNAGNGDGDLMTGLRQLMLADGAGGWTLGPQLLLPPRWLGAYARAVNNAHVAAGTARDSARAYTVRKGQIQLYYSPVVWLDARAGGVAQPLSLPAADAGCRITDVIAQGINNNGRIVGSARQESVVSGAACASHALYWDPPYDPMQPPALLSPSPDFQDPYFSSKVNGVPMDYIAAAINDAGDVAGNLSSSQGFRAVRWMHGNYARPEVLTGWLVWSSAIDECGRILLTGGIYGALPGIWPVGWDGKLTLPLPEGLSLNAAWDFRNGRVAGNAHPVGTTGPLHALLWTLDACPGHWPAQ